MARLHVTRTEEGKIEIQSPRFRVRDSNSDVLFDVSGDEMTARMESLVTPVGGLSVQQAMRTPVVQGMTHQDLRQVRIKACTQMESTAQHAVRCA